MQNQFDFLDDETQKINHDSNAIIENSVVEAYQIIKIKKSVSDKMYKEIIDTIYVNPANPESARNRALTKAKNISNCIVVEKLEKIVASFYEKQL